MLKYIEALRNTLHHLLEKDDSVYVIGEDISEPYGGAFKVTKGLSEKFPERLIQTPMSEQAFTGMAIGMALAGLKPIVEIMFGDFIALVVDQLINHASKFWDIYGKKLYLVLRTPSGGYRGYGATHSQSLERIFMGIPGIKVVAPNILSDPGEVLRRSLYLGKPVVFIENKLDYGREILEKGVVDGVFTLSIYDTTFPVSKLKVLNESSEVSFITYGGMVQILRDVQRKLLFEEDITSEIIALTDISDYDVNLIVQLLESKNVLVVEESWSHFGWGSQVALDLRLMANLEAKRVGARPFNIPAAEPLENYVLPTADRIFEEALQMLSQEV